MLGIEHTIIKNLINVFGGNVYIFALFVIAIFVIAFLITGIPLIAIFPLIVGVFLLVGDIAPEVKLILGLIVGGIIGMFIYGLMRG